MKTKLPLVLLLLSTLHCPLSTWAQGTAFTYQGRLIQSGTPANGVYEMQFTLHDAVTNGNQLGTALAVAPVAITNGLFTALLDFGAAAFDGSSRWLEITLNLYGSEMVPTTLTPRQPITATPYALTARHLTGTVPGTGLQGTYFGRVALVHGDNQFTGAFIGNGAALSNVNALTLDGLAPSSFWQTTGNFGTTPGTHFFGTTDNQPLELRVNNQRALQLQPAPDDDELSAMINVIGGSPSNFIAPDLYGATIAGGGGFQSGGNNFTNAVLGIFGTVSGGAGNTSDAYGTVAGGFGNTSGGGGTVGGGFDNTSTSAASVGGGSGNTSSAVYATVAGGQENTSSGYAATVGGGQNNISSNYNATVPGGVLNVAGGEYSFAAGYRAQALHHGSFVWSDGSSAPFPSTAINQFSIRAGGGVRLQTSGAGMTLDGQPVLSGSITSTQLADAAVTSAKLADGATLSEVLDDDGPGSLLDADTLDSLDSTAFSLSSHHHDSSYWKLDGNAGTTAGTHFVGTTDNRPLEFRVNNLPALRLENPGASGAPNIVAGSPRNFVGAGVVGATIGGGGATNFIGVAHTNFVLGNFSTISGGLDNNIGVNSRYSTIAGGMRIASELIPRPAPSLAVKATRFRPTSRPRPLAAAAAIPFRPTPTLQRSAVATATRPRPTPTTQSSAGESAMRFRPRLGSEPSAAVA